MRLVRLRARRFRCLDDVTVEFHPGLTVVRGDNEAGKSSLYHALMTVLFRSPRSRHRDLLAHRNWDADALFDLELEFIAAGAGHRLSKDFEARTARLENLATGEVWRDPDDVQHRLEGDLGLGPEIVYSRLACVNHDELVRLTADDRSTSELLERLQDAIVGSGSRRSPRQVSRLLDQRLAELRKGLERPAAHPGPLRRLRDDLEALDGRIADARRGLEATEDLRRRLRQFHEEKDSLEQEVIDLGTVVGANERLHQLERQRQALARQYEAGRERLRRVAEAQGELEAARARLEAAGREPAPDREALDRLEALAGRIAALDQSIEAHLAAAAAARPQPAAPRSALAALPWLGVVLAAAGVLLGLLFSSWWLLLTVLGLGLALAPRLAPAPTAPPDPAATLRAQREKTASKLEEALAAWGGQPPGTLRERLERLESARAAVAAAERRLADILGGRPVEEVDREVDDCRRDLRDLEREMEQLAPLRLEPHAFARHQAELRAAQERLDSVMAGIRRTELELARQETEPELLYELEERRAALADRLAGVEEHAAAVALARETLDQAQAELLAEVSGRIAEAVSPYVARLTGGRYRALRTDERLQSVRVVADGREVDWRGLSRGTQDQLYLALRLGLVRLFYGDDPPPLVLDDPCLAFDDRRAAEAAVLFQELARAGQIVLFTFSRRYGDGDRLVTLSGP